MKKAIAMTSTLPLIAKRGIEKRTTRAAVTAQTPQCRANRPRINHPKLPLPAVLPTPLEEIPKHHSSQNTCLNPTVVTSRPWLPRMKWPVHKNADECYADKYVNGPPESGRAFSPHGWRIHVEVIMTLYDWQEQALTRFDRAGWIVSEMAIYRQ